MRLDKVNRKSQLLITSFLVIAMAVAGMSVFPSQTNACVPCDSSWTEVFCDYGQYCTRYCEMSGCRPDPADCDDTVSCENWYCISHPWCQ